MEALIASRNALISFIAAWLLFAVLGSALTTQFVIARLIDLGISVPFMLRLETTARDIIGMFGMFGTIFGLFLAVAILAAHLITRYISYRPEITFTLAGFFAIILGTQLLEALLQITAIAATRSLAGILSLAIIGALAGFVYYIISRRLPR